MVKRRSLDDALTPDQEEFLLGNAKKTAVDPRQPLKKRNAPARSQQKTKKEKPAMNKPAFQEPPAVSTPPQTDAGALPLLVGLNTRIEPRLSNGLLQASMERRIRRLPMAKVQDIVGEALADWMKKHGYLN